MIQNPSFEVAAHPLSDNGFTIYSEPIPGWNTAPYNQATAYLIGVFNPSDFNYPGATDGDATPSIVPDGQNVAYSRDAVLTQLLDDVVQPNTLYELSVDVGYRLDNPFPPAFHVQLVAADVMVENLVPVFPSPGGFATTTISYLVGADDQFIGDHLEIRLWGQGDLGNNTQAHFDNVRLTATSVPEASSFLLLGGAAAAAMLWRRRR